MLLGLELLVHLSQYPVSTMNVNCVKNLMTLHFCWSSDFTALRAPSNCTRCKDAIDDSRIRKAPHRTSQGNHFNRPHETLPYKFYVNEFGRRRRVIWVNLRVRQWLKFYLLVAVALFSDARIILLEVSRMFQLFGDSFSDPLSLLALTFRL